MKADKEDRMLENTKPWYLSRTIWASLVAILAAAGGLFGLPVGDADAAAMTDALLQLVAAVAALIAIAGRLSAKTKIK